MKGGFRLGHKEMMLWKSEVIRLVVASSYDVQGVEGWLPKTGVQVN